MSPSHRNRERELVLLYQRSPDARQTVIEAFRPMARSVARRYHRGEEPLDDLEQVALLGLVKALERFDPERGAPFATYAMPTMSGEIRRHYRDTGWSVHVERGAQELAQKILAYERSCADPPTAEQCAEHLGLTVEQVVAGRVAQRAMRADSLDRPLRAGDSESDGLAINPSAEDRGYSSAEHRATIASLTDGLGERERAILALRYGGELTQAEIGQRVGVSQMHVSRILRRTITELEEAASPV